MKETGIILGHGSNASEWKGKLLTDIAVYLAMQGAFSLTILNLGPIRCVQAVAAAMLIPQGTEVPSSLTLQSYLEE